MNKEYIIRIDKEMRKAIEEYCFYGRKEVIGGECYSGISLGIPFKLIESMDLEIDGKIDLDYCRLFNRQRAIIVTYNYGSFFIYKYNSHIAFKRVLNEPFEHLAI